MGYNIYLILYFAFLLTAFIIIDSQFENYNVSHIKLKYFIIILLIVFFVICFSEFSKGKLKEKYNISESIQTQIELQFKEVV